MPIALWGILGDRRCRPSASVGGWLWECVRFTGAFVFSPGGRHLRAAGAGTTATPPARVHVHLRRNNQGSGPHGGPAQQTTAPLPAQRRGGRREQGGSAEPPARALPQK